MITKIQLRRDTTANWETSNPILSSGEIGIDTDINSFKIGNGTDAWNDLEYFSGQIENLVSDYMAKEDYLDMHDKLLLDKLPDITKQPTLVFATTSEFEAYDTSEIIEGTRAFDNEAKKGYVWKAGTVNDWLVTADADWENINLDWANITNAPKAKDNSSLKDDNVYTVDEADGHFVSQTGLATTLEDYYTSEEAKEDLDTITEEIIANIQSFLEEGE